LTTTDGLIAVFLGRRSAPISCSYPTPHALRQCQPRRKKVGPIRKCRRQTSYMSPNTPPAGLLALENSRTATWMLNPAFETLSRQDVCPRHSPRVLKILEVNPSHVPRSPKWHSPARAPILSPLGSGPIFPRILHPIGSLRYLRPQRQATTSVLEPHGLARQPLRSLPRSACAFHLRPPTAARGEESLLLPASHLQPDPRTPSSSPSPRPTSPSSLVVVALAPSRLSI
jgi:hypothetical protein